MGRLDHNETLTGFCCLALQSFDNEILQIPSELADTDTEAKRVLEEATMAMNS